MKLPDIKCTDIDTRPPPYAPRYEGAPITMMTRESILADIRTIEERQKVENYQQLFPGDLEGLYFALGIVDRKLSRRF